MLYLYSSIRAVPSKLSPERDHTGIKDLVPRRLLTAKEICGNSAPFKHIKRVYISRDLLGETPYTEPNSANFRSNRRSYSLFLA